MCPLNKTDTEKMKNLTALAITAMACLTFCACEKEESNVIDGPTPKEQWGKTLLGNAGTLAAYPDLYSNYWEYTWTKESTAGLALCFKGEFPQARFMSFSLYNDNNGEAIGGLADMEIIPDAGSVNPFVVTSDKHNYFTVYVVPSDATEAQISALGSKNIIRVPAGVERLAIAERQYMGAGEYGGVEMPAITAVDLTTQKAQAAPLRLDSNVSNFPVNYQEQKADFLPDVPFFLAVKGAYYPNMSTDYLFSRTVLADDSLYTFDFIPVPMPKTVEEYKDAKARYWSMCFGSALDTHSYYSINYEQANVPEGEKCYFVVAMQQNSQLEAVKQKVSAQNAQGKNTQLIVWDRTRKSVEGKEIGNCIVTMYRNILANGNWEYSIANSNKIIPTPYGNPVERAKADPDHMIARRALGEYGPQGIKVSTADYLR